MSLSASFLPFLYLFIFIPCLMSGIQPAPSAMLRTTEQNLLKNEAESIKKVWCKWRYSIIGWKAQETAFFLYCPSRLLKWTVEALDQSRNLSFENERRQNEWVARHTANDCVCWDSSIIMAHAILLYLNENDLEKLYLVSYHFTMFEIPQKFSFSIVHSFDFFTLKWTLP